MPVRRRQGHSQADSPLSRPANIHVLPGVNRPENGAAHRRVVQRRRLGVERHYHADFRLLGDPRVKLQAAPSQLFPVRRRRDYHVHQAGLEEGDSFQVHRGRQARTPDRFDRQAVQVGQFRLKVGGIAAEVGARAGRRRLPDPGAGAHYRGLFQAAVPLHYLRGHNLAVSVGQGQQGIAVQEVQVDPQGVVVNDFDFTDAPVGEPGRSGPAGSPQPLVAVGQVFGHQRPPVDREYIVPTHIGTELELKGQVRGQLPAFAQVALQGQAGLEVLLSGADPQQPAVGQARPQGSQGFLVFLVHVPVGEIGHSGHDQGAAVSAVLLCPNWEDHRPRGGFHRRRRGEVNRHRL